MRVKANPGGNVLDFLKLFAVLGHSGDRIVIDGLSACTLVRSTIPRDRISVTPYATLFRAAMIVDRYGDELHTRALTRAMADMYPAVIRTLIKRRGGLSADRSFFTRPDQPISALPLSRRNLIRATN